MADMRRAVLKVQGYLQTLAMAAFLALALALTGFSAAALTGYLPWPGIDLAWNGAPVPQAGMWVTLAFTIFAITLCLFLPSNRRMLRLEHEHRRFAISMDDITRAYVAAHTADREGLFKLTDEFEQMRARLTFLREHPDFSDLEPELLEVAAQMSYESRDLAQRYSDMRVDRARGFLQQRQHELEQFNERIEHAKAINTEFKTWITRIELEESVAASQMERLLEELERILPELNQPDDEIIQTGTVTILPKRLE